MCGIVGQALRSGATGAAACGTSVVERMSAALVHRGPDSGGVHDAGCAQVGMRRLAIVDLSNGAQPMSTEDGRTTLVYNGELYDFRALRARLEAQGARFRTDSDTEVLLRAWAARGERALDDLNGMFAFAIVDRDERTVHLARDPIGIKPLFWYATPGGDLVFASELGALLAHPAVPRVVDRSSLAMLLVDRCVVDPWTMFAGVRQLPPGHLLTWRDGAITVRRYADAARSAEPIADEDEAVAELRRLLDETVRSQLVADVPVGVFLSGGIDSSTVAAYAAAASDGPIASFSVGFDDPAYDESALARAVARHLGTAHHEVRVERDGFDVALFDTIVDHVGQPLTDLSCIPTLVVSRLAREHVKVALSGDGGDELFGGYDHVRWAARVRRVGERTPRLVRRAGQAVLAGFAPFARGGVATRVRRARKGLDLTFFEPLEQVRRLMSLWSHDEAAELVGARTDATLRAWLPDAGAELDGLSPEEFTLAVLARTYLPAAILAKVDRMSMAASLEVRVPLLDRRIVALAARLPIEHKMRGAEGKRCLRAAGRDRLPAAVYEHEKQGFTLPLSAWLGAEFWELAHDLLGPRSRAAELFDARALAGVLERGRRAHADPGRTSAQGAAARAWTLALVGRWMERFEVAA